MVRKVIASACGIDIHVKPGWDYSFFASPYHAHREFSAVDIYQSHDFGDAALSPVEGIVSGVKEYDSPTPGKETLPEYLTFVKKGEYVARMMHYKPSVNEGTNVGVGDRIGELITNGFFTYWTDPGIHLEIRSCGNLMRARGGIELKPVFSKKNDAPNETIHGVVTHSCPRNTTVELSKPAVCLVDGSQAVLDGNLMLDYAGMFGQFPRHGIVYFSGIQIGKVTRTGSYMTQFAAEGLTFHANGRELAGASFVSHGRIMKLLPKKYGATMYEPGEEVELLITKAATQLGL